MIKYPKIQSIFKRDPENKYKTFLEGEWSLPCFDYLKDCKWISEEKIDGTNIRLIWDGEKWDVRGRSDNARLHADLVSNIYQMLYSVTPSEPLTIYGEGCGPGIQKGGGMYGDEKRFIGFDILNQSGRWVSIDDSRQTLSGWSIPIPQRVAECPLTRIYEIVKLGGLESQFNGQPEGVICRPSRELVDEFGNRVITKIKVKDFAHLR